MKIKSEHRKKAVAVLFALLCISFILVKLKNSMLHDSDHAFMLFEGRRIAKGGIQYFNGASPVSGMHIVVQQWLYALILYLVHRAAGWEGVYFMSLAEMALFLWLAYRLTKVHGYSKTTAFYTSLVISTFYAAVITAEKPEIITECLLMTEMIMLEKYAQTEKKKYLAYAVLTVLPEANLHVSTWFVHVLMAGAYMLPYDRIPMLKNQRSRHYDVRPVQAAGIAMCLMSMASPYGIEGTLYIFKSAVSGMAEIGIGELSAPEIKNDTGIMALILLAGALKHVKKEKPETTITFIGCFIMFAIAFRNIQFLMISAVPVAAGYLKYLSKSVLPNTLAYKPLYGLIICYLVITGAAGMALPVSEGKDSSYPRNALRYLRDHEKGERVRIMTTYDTGSYFENAGYIIFMDSRSENWFIGSNKKEEITAKYLNLQNDPYIKTFKRIRKKYGYKYIVADRGSAFKAMCDMDDTLKQVSQDSGPAMYKVIKN